MNSLNTSTDTSAQLEPAVASTKPANVAILMQLTASYEDETFKVLHLALMAVQGKDGPQLDRLAGTLKQL